MLYIIFCCPIEATSIRQVCVCTYLPNTLLRGDRVRDSNVLCILFGFVCVFCCCLFNFLDFIHCLLFFFFKLHLFLLLFTNSHCILHRNFEKFLLLFLWFQCVFVGCILLLFCCLVQFFLLVLFLKLTKFYLWQVKSKVRKSSKQYIRKINKYINIYIFDRYTQHVYVCVYQIYIQYQFKTSFGENIKLYYRCVPRLKKYLGIGIFKCCKKE